MNAKRNRETLRKMPDGVPKADHGFMKAVLYNDESSSDTELQEHFVSEGILPEHAAQYIKHRTRYLNEFSVNDDGTPRWPLKSEEDIRKVMKLRERYY